MSEKMTKEEKQIAMIKGVVFEIAEPHMEFRFTKGRFVYLNMYNKSDRGEIIAESCYSSMTLKSPPLKPEYSREYEIIPPGEATRLMCLGLTLEFKGGTGIKLREKSDYPWAFIDADGELSQYIGVWNAPMRVYQPPKMETRWQYIYRNTRGKFATTKNSYLTVTMAMYNYPSCTDFLKIEESAEQFEVGE